MGVYVTGVIGVIVFYVAVLAVGIWAAAFKRRQAAQGHLQDDMMLANRRLGPLLGIFTLVGNCPPAEKFSRRREKNEYPTKIVSLHVRMKIRTFGYCDKIRFAD